MTHTSTEQERTKMEDFEHWAISTNQGYNLTRNKSGLMQTYEYVGTEHAWRGFFHGWQAARRSIVVQQQCDLCKDDGGYFYGRTGYEPCCVG